MATPVPATEFKVSFAENRLTLQAVDVPLRSILAQFTEADIEVRISPEINPRVTASFSDEPLAAGLNRILGPLNHALIWRQIESPLGPIQRLAEIQIFEAGRRQAMEPLPQPTHFELARDPFSGAAYVRREVLLGLKPGMDRARFRKILAEIGATVVDSHGATGIYRLRLDQDQDIPGLARALNDMPGVARAEPNWAHRLPPSANRLAQSEAPVSSIAPYAGENAVPIAVLDSGLATGADLQTLTLATLDALDPQAPISDTLGHGTQMALIASGAVTPMNAVPYDREDGPSIIAVRAFDDQGVTSNFVLMESMDFSIAQGARVMSLSWGTETPSQFLEATMNYGRSQGLIIVAAAGNEPTGRPYYPAAYPAVIGVGALNQDGEPWENSNYGDFVTLSAPGVAALPIGYQGKPGIYAGTSIATAYVANRIAGALADNPDKELTAILADLSSAP
ncbi:MAG: S8 family serine peptidase [Desulfobacterales bacterium]